MNDAELVRLVDDLEERADGYVTVEDVERTLGCAVSGQITTGILLVDYRTRVDGTPVTLCRLNRHHPLVAELTGW
jgi:hypothetical protein